jgi:hypothetical protein
METLEEARAWLEHHKEDGVRCPCCTQLAKIYTRKLNSAMARDLIWLVRRFKHTSDWIDVSTTAPISLQRSRELAKLVHWKLVECKPEASTRGARTSGIWRPTWPGIMFAENKTALPKYVRLYDGGFLSYPDKGVTTIREALGDHFDYDELWGRK